MSSSASKAPSSESKQPNTSTPIWKNMSPTDFEGHINNLRIDQLKTLQQDDDLSIVQIRIVSRVLNQKIEQKGTEDAKKARDDGKKEGRREGVTEGVKIGTASKYGVAGAVGGAAAGYGLTALLVKASLFAPQCTVPVVGAVATAKIGAATASALAAAGAAVYGYRNS